ncbi:CD226 antigen [Phascolarctos cinereus]|uniref:CD226 antigen n=1 Tax=Phascolarctos cinereus TaxID=38626 RepID=A0A6P5K7H7_PHACI|nr:CD226 antigen [Phascolarctos cinereus]
MHCLPFLFVILQAHKALPEEEFVDTTIKFAKNMIFECTYPGSDFISQAEWFKITVSGKNSMAIFSPKFGGLIRTDYISRVHFLNSSVTANDVSLFFRNASKADLGLYHCILQLFPLGRWEKVINVVQSDDFEIRVPSNSHMVSEPGKNVKFIFQPHMASPLKHVTWERIQPHQIDHLTSCNLNNGKSYGLKYQRKILTSCNQGMKSSSIVIHNVTASDSGFYQCCLTTNIGENETFVMRLTVTDAKTDHQIIFFMAGGAASFLLLVISIIIITYCCRRKKVSKALWDTQNQPSKNYARSGVPEQTQDCKEEDIYVNCPAFSQRPNPR